LSVYQIYHLYVRFLCSSYGVAGLAPEVASLHLTDWLQRPWSEVCYAVKAVMDATSERLNAGRPGIESVEMCLMRKVPT